MASLSPYAITLGSTDYPVKYAGLLSYVEPYLTNLESFTFSAGNVSLAANFTLGAASDLTLNKGTANGVLYLNGSKVATSGSALTFNGTVLGVTAELDVKSANNLLFLNSDNTNYIFLNNPAGTGAGIGQLAFTLGGVGELMRLTSTGLGIGTSSPGAKLESLVTSTTTPSLRLRYNASSYYADHLMNGNGDYIISSPASNGVTSGNLSIQAGAALKLFTNGSSTVGTAQLMVDTSGNLGIGTTPTRKLTIYGAGASGVSASNPAIRLDNNTTGRFALYEASGDGNLYIWNSDTGAGSTVFLRGSGSGTETARFDSSGNLGLGVTPSAWGSVWKAQQLQAGAFIASQTNANDIIHVGTNAFANASNVWTYINTAAATRYQQYLGAHSWFTAPSGTAGNAISFTQALTLDASGNLQLGATSGSGNRLNVVGTGGIRVNEDGASTKVITIRSDFAGVDPSVMVTSNHALLLGTNNTERARITSGGDLLVGTTSTAFTGKVVTLQATSASNVLTAWNSATTGDNSFVGFFTDGGTGRGSIDYNRAGGLVRYNTTSDYRAKDIIGPVQNVGATIDALKVYEGVMKGATQSRPMLIAHEAQQHAPYAVSGVKDEVNEDGTPKFQQMDVSSLVPLLLAEIQSLRARVAALEAQP